MNIAIDLGSDRTRVFIENKGKVLDEASVVAYDTDTEQVIEAGDRAFKMIGKTPGGIEAVRPLDGGVIARSELVEEMVIILLGNVCPVKLTKPRAVTAVPCDVTEVEKRAVVNAIGAFGMRNVYLIESPKAAALGCGLDIMSPHGILIADIGSGNADIAVLSLGGIAVSETIKTAGRAMDEEIIKYARKKFGLIIGENMAESCKKAIGCVKIIGTSETFRLKGRDAVSGLPRYVDVSSEDIMEAISETAEFIISAIGDVLEKTPPELTSDIFSDGIILTGGLARLKGFARLLSERTKLRVRVHKNAPDCVIEGCGKAIKYISGDEAQSPTNPILTAF